MAVGKTHISRWFLRVLKSASNRCKPLQHKWYTDYPSTHTRSVSVSHTTSPLVFFTQYCEITVGDNADTHHIMLHHFTFFWPPLGITQTFSPCYKGGYILLQTRREWTYLSDGLCACPFLWLSKMDKLTLTPTSHSDWPAVRRRESGF